jgi:hypothetical protein
VAHGDAVVGAVVHACRTGQRVGPHDLCALGADGGLNLDVLARKIVWELTPVWRGEGHCSDTVDLGGDVAYPELTVSLPRSLASFGHRVKFDLASEGSMGNRTADRVSFIGREQAVGVAAGSAAHRKRVAVQFRA